MDSTALRLLVCWIAVVGVACRGPAKPCNSVDADCGAGMCDLTIGQCVAAGNVCPGACSTYQECISNACTSRYDSLALTAPANNALQDGGTVVVTAQLQLHPGATANDPQQLDLDVTPGSGTATRSKLNRTDAGFYQLALTPGDGTYSAIARYTEAGLNSSPVSFTIDTTPPAFTIVVPNPLRGDGGTLIDQDPALLGAWRRDEVATITATSPARDIDPSSVKLMVTGVGDGGPQGVEQSPVLLAQQSCDAGYCGTYSLNLWEPQFRAFRGQFALVVNGADKAGNSSSVDGGVAVTRWKWEYNANAGVIAASPAIGSAGIVYVGTNAGNTSQFIALSPQGNLLWSRHADSSILASASVGATSGTGEIVYYGTTGTSGILIAVSGGDGGEIIRCSIAGDVEGALALETTAATRTVESAIGVLNTTKRIVALRPDGGQGPGNVDENCVFSQATNNVAPGGGVVASDGGFYYADEFSNLQGFSFGNGGLSSKGNGWPLNIGSQVGKTPAIVGTKIVLGAAAGSSGALLAVDSSSAQLSWSLTRPAAPAWNVSADSNGRLLAGFGDNNLLAVVPVDGGTVLSGATVGVVQGAPTIGEGGYFYTADTTGVVQAWRLDSLRAEWALSDSTRLGSVQGSVALDCSRDNAGRVIPGRPGVMYVGSANNGHLFSFITDSRGIDTSAPWPKYQHDPRNTGNAQTPLSQFACP